MPSRSHTDFWQLGQALNEEVMWYVRITRTYGIIVCALHLIDGNSEQQYNVQSKNVEKRGVWEQYREKGS